MQPAGCVEAQGLSPAKVAAFQFYGALQLKPMQSQSSCPWLIAEAQGDMVALHSVDNTQWELLAQLHHPADGDEAVLIFRRR
jgi:hypothetical protein